MPFPNPTAIADIKVSEYRLESQGDDGIKPCVERSGTLGIGPAENRNPQEG